MPKQVGVNSGQEFSIDQAAQNNWGGSGENPLANQNLAGSKPAGSGQYLYSPGFSAYLDQHLAQSGDLQPRQGATPVYKSGPFAGMDEHQAQSKALDMYGALSDQERQSYAPPVSPQTGQVAQLPHVAAQQQNATNAYQAGGAPTATPPSAPGAGAATTTQPIVPPQQANPQQAADAGAANAATQRALSTGIGQPTASQAAPPPNLSGYAGPTAAPLGPNELDPVTGKPRTQAGIIA